MMPAGPGKYDDVATMVRTSTRARGVIVVIQDGAKGSGFSVQGDVPFTMALPDMLEGMAAEIRRSLQQGQV